MLKKITGGLMGIAFLAISGPAHAAPILSNTLVLPTVVDFSQFAPAPVISSGPIQVGGLVGENITVSGDPNSSLFLTNIPGWSLINNGGWGSGRNGYFGANNASPGSATFTFHDGPVSGVGGFMNSCLGCDPNDEDLVISVFDVSNVLLETYNVSTNAPILTPGGSNAGAFRGFSRATNDIASFSVTGHFQVVDDLAFTRASAQVPEAGTVALFGLGLAGLGYARRKRTG